ncbi:probable receptor-like protein kinase At5g39020 [Humulus lupulus]|uniref:probable receptor-like protein kinase At5g39020 n=1 Tax=Humulus lupulus TaxID=3486 RepID=UPI002B40C88C|nr:probable receptor-like protein kinase At5g39020 [Humulus lupulus]
MEALHLILITIITILHEISSTHSSNYNTTTMTTANCSSSSCGDVHNIVFPFRLETDPSSSRCAPSWACYEDFIDLSCENNKLFTHYGYGLVRAINSKNFTIRLVDPNLRKGDCSSIPMQLTESFRYYDFELETRVRNGDKFRRYQLSEFVLYLSCENKVYNNSLYIDTAPCINSSTFSKQNPKGRFVYVVYASGFKYSDLADSCQIVRSAVVSAKDGDEKRKKMSYRNIHDEFTNGFELSYLPKMAINAASQKETVRPFRNIDEMSCFSIGGTRFLMLCRLWDIIKDFLLYNIIPAFIIERLKQIVEILAPRTTIGISFMIGLVIYKWRRRHLSAYDGIEKFLQSQNNLIPIRYAYSDIKKMSKDFKIKLGEGGFGSVYKGTLCSGHFVAIKMLGKSKNSSWQDFINEVSTIGRIHHVNVVRLVGFCVEGSKRALVYEYMPNGSLNNHIFLIDQEINNSLCDGKIFDISLGIARGIEYLHQGCDMQILHFDIKPHNILLDENFIPKISDFGLARLCPLENSIVSLTAVRGTTGYIAPELFYKNIGGVSHKADVYSFGMLLIEMASRRKNLNTQAEHSSQIYFPLWVYDHVKKERMIEQEDITNEEHEEEITKKMIVVALWCIQLKPCDRPSMSKVIEMLEGDVECLEMPPKPCLYPQESYNNAEATTEDT